MTAKAVEEVMASKLDTVFEDIGAWFKKVFKKLPSAEAQALSTINAVAPEAEIVFSLVDPAAAAIADPIITEIQADLGTVANLLKSGNTVSLGTFLTAIKSNLSTLLTAGHISDPASVTKATGIVSGIVGVIDSLLNQYAPSQA
jgi:hypothetical protein